MPKSANKTARPLTRKEKAARARDLIEARGRMTLDRVDCEIRWYDRRSVLNRSLYKIMKTLTIASAAVIPVLTTSSIPYGTRIAAALGVLIAVIEGIQQLNHYQANWASYRTAAETLKHEKYRFLCRIGSYSKTSNPYSMLAERVESIISQETEKWLTGEAQTAPNYSTRTARHN